jgi:hypothetical protein
VEERPGGREGEPGIGDARERAARAGGETRNDDRLPAPSAVQADARDDPARTAVPPSVLLPDADHAARIRRVDGKVRLDRRTDVEAALLPRIGRTRSQRVGSRDRNEHPELRRGDGDLPREERSEAKRIRAPELAAYSATPTHHEGDSKDLHVHDSIPRSLGSWW